jgi:hypothetical protein
VTVSSDYPQSGFHTASCHWLPPGQKLLIPSRTNQTCRLIGWKSEVRARCPFFSSSLSTSRVEIQCGSPCLTSILALSPFGGYQSAVSFVDEVTEQQKKLPVQGWTIPKQGLPALASFRCRVRMLRRWDGWLNRLMRFKSRHSPRSRGRIINSITQAKLLTAAQLVAHDRSSSHLIKIRHRSSNKVNIQWTPTPTPNQQAPATSSRSPSSCHWTPTARRHCISETD